MNHPTFQTIEADARAQGFDEVTPDTVLASHTRTFALWALVVHGEMWLTVGDEVRHLRPGDEFALGVLLAPRA